MTDQRGDKSKIRFVGQLIFDDGKRIIEGTMSADEILDALPSATEPKRIDPQYIGASVSGAWVKEWQDRADQLERELAEANRDKAQLQYALEQSEAQFSSTNPTFPLDPTKAMIEAGAQRLVRWEEESKWPGSWSLMDVRASRNDAERVWRSMWLEAEKNAAPQDSQADRNFSGSQPPEVPADAAAQQSVKLQGDPQNANTSGTVRESAYVPAEQPVVASVGPIDAYAVRRAMQEFPAEYQTADLLVTLKAAISTYLACVTAVPSAKLEPQAESLLRECLRELRRWKSHE